jgi:phosphoribosyl 1,2-cyclic phosphodiesterase
VGQIVRHTLIDCGMGVVPSLLEFEHTHGVHVVHEVLLTHLHFDHFAQLDWLSMCLVRSCRPDQPRPLPIYASPECWENGPNRVHRYLAQRSDFRQIQPGIAVLLGDLTVTPFAVDHGPKAPGAVGFVVQHRSRKIVITGDFLRIPEEDNPLLFDADVMFLDANTWHPADRTSHQSVLGNLHLIDKWRPKRAYMVHYSGYEDREHAGDPVSGPMDAARFRDELCRVADGRDIRPTEHGMVLGDKLPWPE